MSEGDVSDADASDPTRAGAVGSDRSVGRPRQSIRRLDEWFAGLREDPNRRRVALAAAFVAGLALAWVHWLGLVAGGALIGLTRRTLARALVAGIGFGAVALVLTVLVPGTVGIGAVDAFAPASYVAIAVGLLLPAWGALLRGVV